MRTKDDLRKEAREARLKISDARRAHAAESAARQLLALPELRAARCVLVYAPLPDELDPLCVRGTYNLTHPTVCQVIRPPDTPQLAWPRVDGRVTGKLTLHVCAQDELAPGSFGIREPREDAPRVALCDIDVALVPGLAFDQAGYRVGYGKGYYDRLLADAPATLLTIGLCFKETFYPEIAHDAHDIAVARVIVA
ncbi:MAG: 5-formyltetrahydrofolate cyclo-ligase [Coriobacteriia bacterium]|nr:5-formyltetrahydrofolate cyclo-ligase [Coriobacteriia bacterium]